MRFIASELFDLLDLIGWFFLLNLRFDQTQLHALDLDKGEIQERYEEKVYASHCALLLSKNYELI